MKDNNIINLNKLEQNDPLQEVLGEGARKLLATAIESEVTAFIEQQSGLKTDEGKPAVVRNGYLSERSIQTGLVTSMSKSRRSGIVVAQVSNLIAAWCPLT